MTVRHNLFLTRFDAFAFSNEIVGLAVEHNTVMNGGWFMRLDPGWVWPAGSPTARNGAFAVQQLVVRNNLAFGNNGGLICDVAHGTRCFTGVEDKPGYAPDAVWTHNVLAGEPRNTYPEVTLRPSVEAHRAQFTAEGQLVANSSYRAAGSDGIDLGAVR